VSRMTRGRPWARLKIAASLDGITALPDGRSKWITSAAARADGHQWRARACALVTGIGTVKSDNPQLNVRGVFTSRQPAKVLIDSRLEVNPAAELFRDAKVLVIHALPPESVEPERAARLQEAGCQLVSLPGAGGKVDLAAALQELGRREFNELHIEAGHKLNGSLIAAGCVDELLVYLAPSLLGQGRQLFNLPPVADLESRIGLQWLDVERIGDDLRLRAKVVGRPPAP
jgi:diaminohydroxyphosphoribosylaminopyrimidine deaminase / 5-amino-6-(5-phosphoribosylamino)uracil reductase